ncbi:MAG TPA: glycosyltransferase family A protein [Candidatus Binatia bacterium]|jgi:glycosyltransferase involved in cell wall biosynthesis
MPRVSVIIPAYNRKAMLCEAVDSVLAQNYRDFALFVVDDGSTDGTAEELAVRYGERVRVLRQANGGVAAARNFGVRCSDSEYIAFLDSDDLWRPKKLALQVKFMEADSRRRICQTEEIWIRNGVRVNAKTKHRKPAGDVFRASLELCLVSPSAVLMKRGLFDEVGGLDETFPVCEDYDLWLRISRDHRIELVRDALVIKRGGHADQLSRSTWGFDRFRVRALQKLLRSGLTGEKRAWTIDALARKANILAAGARKRGREGEALEYDNLAAEFIGESDGRGDPVVLPEQGLSPAYRGALARL